MARETRRSGEKNDGQDLEMEKFIKDYWKTHHENNLERKMSKSFRQFKKGDFGLREVQKGITTRSMITGQTSG